MRATNTRRLGGLVAAVFLSTVLGVSIAYWRNARGTQKQQAVVPQILPADVHQQLAGYTFTRSEGGREIFTVQAARTVALKDGVTTLLEDVKVEMFGRAGNRHDFLNAGKCQYNSQSGGLSCFGPVEIELGAQPGSPGPSAGAGGTETASNSFHGWQPVYVETSNVAFEQRSSTVASSGPVRFRYGPATGSALGLTYATRDGRLELKKDVVMDAVPPSSRSLKRQAPKLVTDPAGPGASDQTNAAQPAWHVTAGSLRYAKDTGQIALSSPVEITEGSLHLTSDRATISLDARNRVTFVLLESGVSGSDTEEGQVFDLRAEKLRAEFDTEQEQIRGLAASGEVRLESRRDSPSSSTSLAADEVRLNFSGPRARPQGGTASGNVAVSLESSPAGEARPAARAQALTSSSAAAQATGGRLERQTLTASELQFSFRAEGQGLREAHTRGPGNLVLVPADRRQGERVVRAGQFLMAFDDRSRLQIIRGLSPARVVVQPPRNASTKAIPAVSSSKELLAILDPATETIQTLDQTGDFQLVDGDRQASAEQAHYSAAGQMLTLTGKPLLWDSDSRVLAERVQIDLRNNTAEAVGHVRSTRFGDDHHAPGSTTEATNIVADKMVVDRQSEHLHYEGHARAWQGYDVVESPSLDIYWKQRRITSGSGVVTSDLEPNAEKSRESFAASPAKAKSGASGGARGTTRPVTIRADHLEYLDLGRRASYTGHVQLQSEEATLASDHLDAYFSGSGTVEGAKIERAVAEGHVTVVEPGRRATGDHAEYFAGSGRIVMTGGPPTLYDTEKGFATGQRLTFFIHDASLTVDGDPKSPALSKHRIGQ